MNHCATISERHFQSFATYTDGQLCPCCFESQPLNFPRWAWVWARYWHHLFHPLGCSQLSSYLQDTVEGCIFYWFKFSNRQIITERYYESRFCLLFWAYPDKWSLGNWVSYYSSTDYYSGHIAHHHKLSRNYLTHHLECQRVIEWQVSRRSLTLFSFVKAVSMQLASTQVHIFHSLLPQAWVWFWARYIQSQNLTVENRHGSGGRYRASLFSPNLYSRKRGDCGCYMGQIGGWLGFYPTAFSLNLWLLLISSSETLISLGSLCLDTS